VPPREPHRDSSHRLATDIVEQLGIETATVTLKGIAVRLGVIPTGTLRNIEEHLAAVDVFRLVRAMDLPAAEVDRTVADLEHVLEVGLVLGALLRAEAGHS
jgi:hypothetical protein